MSFEVAADAYTRFMGRYSSPLALTLIDRLGLGRGQRLVDVGCGAGAFTAAAVERLGPDGVAAVDPSEDLIEGARTATPQVAVASAEQLPFGDAAFGAAVAQLVVHFMADPVRGLAEMGRVVRSGGSVAASVWDQRRGPSTLLWRAAQDVDPSVEDEMTLPGVAPGHLGDLFRAADLEIVEDTVAGVAVRHPTFEEWWDPFELGVGPPGAYVASLDPEHRAAVRDRCRELQPDAPFTATVHAWTVIGRAR